MAPPPTVSAECRSRSRKQCNPQAAIQGHPLLRRLLRDPLTSGLTQPVQLPRRILILTLLTALPLNLPVCVAPHLPLHRLLLSHRVARLPQLLTPSRLWPRLRRRASQRRWKRRPFLRRSLLPLPTQNP